MICLETIKTKKVKFLLEIKTIIFNRKPKNNNHKKLIHKKEKKKDKNKKILAKISLLKGI